MIFHPSLSITGKSRSSKDNKASLQGVVIEGVSRRKRWEYGQAVPELNSLLHRPSIPFCRSSEGGFGPQKMEKTASPSPFPSETVNSLFPTCSVVPFAGR